MEFGLFLGGFVHRDLAAANPNAEHDRLMSEVRLCEVADQHNWKYAWFTEHHFLEEYSHISANEVLMPWVLARTERLHVGSGIINVTPPVNHPARVAERVAMMDHVSERALRVRHRTGIVDHRDGRLRDHRPRAHPRHVRRSDVPSSRACGAKPNTRSTASSSRCPTRNVLPKPYVKPHPPMWVAAGNPGDVREGRADGPRRVVLHRRRAREDGAAHRALQEDDRERRSRRRVRQRQRRGHHELHVPRRRATRRRTG